MSGSRDFEISVVIPVFNTERYLAQAIQSVLAQDLQAVEVFVVDDGSTDRSVAIAESFGGRVRVLRQEHEGIGAARNRAIRVAAGAVIGFLDADDLWPAGSVERRAAVLLARPDVDVAIGRVSQFLGDEPTAGELVDGAGYLAGAMLVRRALFDRIGLFDESLRVGELIDWLARAHDAGFVPVSIDDVVLLRRIHGDNTTAHAAVSGANLDYLRVVRTALARRRQGQR